MLCVPMLIFVEFAIFWGITPLVLVEHEMYLSTVKASVSTKKIQIIPWYTSQKRCLTSICSNRENCKEDGRSIEVQET